MAPSRYSIGVLLVHGIGDQRRGQTLTHFGEPLFRGLERCLRHRNGGASLERVVTSPVTMASRVPAHAVITLGHSDVDSRARWLVAESHWGDVFERPSFRTVAVWAIGVVPWMILTQFADDLERALRSEKVGRSALAFASLVFTFPLALLIQIAVLVLVPLALIPPLNPLVAPTQRWMSGVLGDSFVLLTSPFQLQSMVSTVRKDLEWLATRCDAIAVVAHSQGAALAHEAVRQAAEPKVKRLITLGSAVSRLKGLKYVTENAPGMFLASTLVTIASLVLGTLYAWNLLVTTETLLALAGGLAGLCVLLALSAYVMPFTLKGINRLRHSHQGFELPKGVEWEDYYASADPIPNGPMFDPADRISYATVSESVENTANPFCDHSAYWRNEDQFVTAVVGSLLRLAGPPLSEAAPGQADLFAASIRRIRRTRYRIAARIVGLAVLVLGVLPHPALGRGVAVPPPLAAPLGWISRLLNWMISLVEDALGVVMTTLNLVDTPLTMPAIPLPVTRVPWAVACAIAALVWVALSAATIRKWERGDTEDVFQLQAVPRGIRPVHAWWTAFALTAAAWLGFWGWWVALSPINLVASGIWESLGRGFSATSGLLVYLPILVYQFVKSLAETAAAWQRQKIAHLREKAQAGPLPPPLARLHPRAAEVVYRFPSAVLSEVRRQSFRENVTDIWDVVRDSFRAVKRALVGAAPWLVTREVGVGVACGFALFAAAVSLWLVQMEFSARPVVQSALGLISLGFGVYGWVRAGAATADTAREDREKKALAAGIGLVVGVEIMPTSEAFAHGFGTLAGWSLLGAAIAAAVCALGGAEALRRAWHTIGK